MARDGCSVAPEVAAAVATKQRGEPLNVAEFCAKEGLSRKTFYKYLARFAAEGVPGLHVRSRRPVSSPTRTSVGVEDLLVLARKRLDEAGWDAGADSIVYWLLDHPDQWPAGLSRLPSRATINRVLTRRGMVVAVPKRAPKKHRRRFEAAHPNDRWQMDGFEYELDTGRIIVVMHLLDDCSRFDLALRAGLSENATDVWATFTQAAGRYGLPAQLLTDNGTAFSGRRRGWSSALEVNTAAVGVHHFTSSVGHPQTCGKVERAHQTVQKWLRKQPQAHTIEQLNQLLEQCRQYLNERRRRKHLGGLTPAERYAMTPKGGPAEPGARPLPVLLVQRTVTASGSVNIQGVQVYLGRKYAGSQATVILQGQRLTAFISNQLISELTLTSGKRGYQPKTPLLPKS